MQVVTLNVNAERRHAAVHPSATLCEVLRYHLGLTGTKQGCDKGDCGACTVLVDGRPHLSCITLALSVQEREIRTVEGLKTKEGLHPVQDAFDVCGAAQCGFCTPGIMMSAVALLEVDPSPSRDAIKHALSGNLCRCTGYTKILDAVELAAEATDAVEADIA